MSLESTLNKPFFYSVFLKTLPLLASALFGQLSGLVNTILTGHYGIYDLAAVSFGFIFMMTVTSLSQGLLNATLPFLQESRHKSQEEFMEMNNNAKWLLIFSMTFVTVVYFLARLYLNNTDHSELYITRVKAYLNPIGVFMLVILVFSYNINLLIVSGKTKPIALFGLTATTTDVLTSSLLVFGLFGLPALGAAGAALGSLMGATTIVIISSLYISRSCNLPKQYKFWSLSKPDWFQLKVIFSVGGPSSVLAFLSWGSIFGLTLVLTTLSPQWVAANQIAFVLSTLALVVVNSSSSIATNSLVEARLTDQTSLYNSTQSLYLGFAAVSLIVAILIAIFLEHLTSIFGGDHQTLSLLSPLKLPFVLFVTLSSLNLTLRAALLAHKKTQISLYSQIVAITLLIPLVFLASSFQALSLTVVWWCLCVERVIQVVLNLVWLKQDDTRSNLYETV